MVLHPPDLKKKKRTKMEGDEEEAYSDLTDLMAISWRGNRLTLTKMTSLTIGAVLAAPALLTDFVPVFVAAEVS